MTPFPLWSILLVSFAYQKNRESNIDYQKSYKFNEEKALVQIINNHNWRLKIL